MLQRWMFFLFSYPGFVALLLGIIALFLGIYIWSATKIRRSRERRTQAIRDTLYITTPLLGQLTLIENRQSTRTESEQHELLNAMLACRTAVSLSPQLQDQIRSCIQDPDPARLTLIHRALERESSSLSEELRSQTQSVQWWEAVWNVIRPAVEPLAVAALLYLIADFIIVQQGLNQPFWRGWAYALFWIRFISLCITVLYGYLLLASPRRGTPGASGTMTKVLYALIALCSLLHLIGPVTAPYALGLQLILFVSGFRLSGTSSRSERPYAGHTELEPAKEASTETEVNTTRKSGAKVHE
ncbi:hypothetical protein MH215_20220 [Paenibacillus sp. ACRSA]|uniref:hypothetical protein n=1 Tax=Paenibacillus sp. ACRSA TaxID=2918211 RepID=UPI001EF6E3BC|nr:hypothetical protein [Paenibacillus sp. ACRSA]MCG7379330.1 hypothetical protein [Paenibacillus sp. ACRSA]